MTSKIPGLTLAILAALSVIGIALCFVETYDPALQMSYAYMVLAMVGVLALAIQGLLSNPKSVKSTAIGLGVVVVLAGLSYGLADDSVLPAWGDLSAGMSKLIDAMLIGMYLLIGGSLLAVVYSSIANLLK